MFLNPIIPNHQLISGKTGRYSKFNEKSYEGESLYSGIAFATSGDAREYTAKMGQLVSEAISKVDKAPYVPIMTLESDLGNNIHYRVKLIKVSRPDYEYLYDAYFEYNVPFQFDFVKAPQELIDNYLTYIDEFYKIIPTDQFSDMLKHNMKASLLDLFTKDFNLKDRVISDDQYLNMFVSARAGSFTYRLEAIMDKEGKLVKLGD